MCVSVCVFICIRMRVYIFMGCRGLEKVFFIEYFEFSFMVYVGDILKYMEGGVLFKGCFGLGKFRSFFCFIGKKMLKIVFIYIGVFG